MLGKVKEEVLKPLKKVCRARPYQRSKLAEELFGEKSLKDGVDKKLKRLFQFFGVSKMPIERCVGCHTTDQS